MTEIETTGRRICRTAADCYQAGWEDGEHDQPLTQSETDRLVALLGPGLRERKAS